ncbi:hypothetical protein AMATHDRAFT_45847 [Amanita thiersii Skay4041]|uniref:Galactose oxidase n=1 Tax=Amanita thiersii Skay4041 TaxID=703135 RepID=A0A2A9NQX0_9AGAR|nr:hypothetical protein AMATHDRAFT_45847 [Amanita thiersii Skay4041]
MTRGIATLLLLQVTFLPQCWAYTPDARWGQAAAVVSNALFIYGGKSDPFNSYSYTSAPNVNDLLMLPLQNSFEATSPPWQLIPQSPDEVSQQSPALAWHTISTINNSYLLLFGGEPGPNSPIVLVDLADSAYYLNLLNSTPLEWKAQSSSFSNQPLRRIRHATAISPSGLVFITGGEKADGSNNALADHYIFDASNSAFERLPQENGPLGVYGHASIMLGDGRLLVFGGYSQTQGSLVPLSTIWIIDTQRNPLTWSLASVSNVTLPSPRRAFANTLLEGDQVLIHGGSDASMQNNFADGWVLNTSSNPMSWSEVGALSRLGARRDHFAISLGKNVLFGFGYGSSGPISPSLTIYDASNGIFETTYSPPSPMTTTTKYTMMPTTSDSQSNVHPTSTGGPNGDSGNDNQRDRANRTKAIALGVSFALLGLVLVAVFVYYARQRYQRRHQGGGHFVSLSGDDDGYDHHHSIPAVVMVERGSLSGRRYMTGLFSTFQIAGVMGGRPDRVTGRRKDMLADEDDQSDWHYLRNRRRTDNSSFSFRSFFSGHNASRAPSFTNASMTSHWRDKSNPFPDEVLKDEVDSLITKPSMISVPQHQVHGELLSSQYYTDPFSHVSEGSEEEGLYDMTSPRDQSLMPSLGPRGDIASKHVSTQTVRSRLEDSGSFAPSNLDHNSPKLGSISASSETTSSGIHNVIPVPVPSSFINANPRPTHDINRSNSWWTRFTRSSFLERGPSNPSKISPLSLEHRDLGLFSLEPIEERPNSVVLKSTVVKSVEVSSNEFDFHSGSSGAYDGKHGKSFSSLGTANTEAIERIGGAMDVIQRIRTASYRSSIGSTFNDSIETKEHEDSPCECQDIHPLEPAPAGPSENPFASQDDEHINSRSIIPPNVDSCPSPITTDRRPMGALVATHVQAYERRLSQDHEEKRNIVAVKYGLAPRPSLYIANPEV